MCLVYIHKKGYPALCVGLGFSFGACLARSINFFCLQSPSSLPQASVFVVLKSPTKLVRGGRRLENRVGFARIMSSFKNPRLISFRLRIFHWQAVPEV
jgi:hypothetical protein